MTTVCITEAKARLSRLIQDVVSGRQDQVVITRHGKVVACLGPLHSADVSKRVGLAKGRFEVSAVLGRQNMRIATLFFGRRRKR